MKGSKKNSPSPGGKTEEAQEVKAGTTEGYTLKGKAERASSKRKMKKREMISRR